MKKQLLLSLLLILPLVASADAVEIDGIYYNLSTDENVAEVTSIPYELGSKYTGSISIPEEVTYNDVVYSVTSIGDDAFAECSSLTSVAIPNSVTSIGGAAFYGCSSLTSVTIPNSVTSIGINAFLVCTGLNSITIPNSVTSIGSNAFSGCSGLTYIKVEEGNSIYDSRNNCNAVIERITNMLLFGCQNTIIPNSVTSIGGAAFYGCSSLTSVTIPNSVTSIGKGAFSNCTGLTSISIPNSVTSIGTNAFSGCSGLTYIKVEEGNSIYDSRDNCNAVIESEFNMLLFGCQNTIIPNSVTSIGSGAFSRCSSLTSITIPNSVTSIGSSAFSSCSSLTSIAIPNSVTSIGFSAFIECSSLTSVTIPNSVSSIENYAFMYCPSLTDITISNNVTSIGDYTFWGCSSLNSVTIPNSVTSIGNGAFGDCSSLTSITIPIDVTSIGGYVFYGCIGLTSVSVLNPTPVAISQDTFTNRTNAFLYVPSGCKGAYEAADYWNEFKEIIEKDFTGIDQIMIDGQNNAKIFTLDGKRISKPRKGINIIGGKKVLVKY